MAARPASSLEEGVMSEFQTFNDIMAGMCAKQPDRPCITFEGKTFSYRQVDDAASRIAAGLFDAGVRHGQKVSLLVENKPEIVFSYLALCKLGAVGVPVNTAAKGELLAYYLEKSDSEVVISDSEFLSRLAPVLARTRVRVVFEVDEANPVAPRQLGSGTPVRDFRDLASHAPLTHEQTPTVVPQDTYMLLYTSGTTGRSKASVGTHHSALTIGRIMAEAYEYQPDDVLYVCLPLFHGNGMRGNARWSPRSWPAHPSCSPGDFRFPTSGRKWARWA
jgi:carnitine-CoA ligase